MAKTFSELKTGDQLWIWWLDTLLQTTIKDIKNPVKSINGEYLYLQIVTEKGSFTAFSDVMKCSAFVYGTDGLEHKIIGTSKEAVRDTLKESLEFKKKEIEMKTELWLKNFD